MWLRAGSIKRSLLPCTLTHSAPLQDIDLFTMFPLMFPYRFESKCQALRHVAALVPSLMRGHMHIFVPKAYLDFMRERNRKPALFRFSSVFSPQKRGPEITGQLTRGCEPGAEGNKGRSNRCAALLTVTTGIGSGRGQERGAKAAGCL